MAKSDSRKTAGKTSAASKKVAKKKVTKKTAPKKKVSKKKTSKKVVSKKTVAKAATKQTRSTTRTGATISDEERRMMVAMHAYFKWEQAGFPGGQDWQHWLEAEREVEEMFK